MANKLSNRFVDLGKPATLVAGPTPQYLPGTGYLTNAGYDEVQFFLRRHTAGSGTLVVTLQEFIPGGNYFVDCVGGAGAVIKFIDYTAAAADAADTPRRLRVGQNITSADTDGYLAVGATHNWFDYTPPQFWRLKFVESATGSIVYCSAHFSRG